MRIPLVAEVADEAESPHEGRPTDRARDSAFLGGLVARVAAGDDTALGELYDRFGRPAYSLARRICADDGLAEDVVQEVFLVLWRTPEKFDPERGSFGTWLLTLVHHKAVDAVRKESAVRRRTAAQPQAGEVGPAGPGADHEALGAVVAGQVRLALGGLPVEQRQALALAYYGGYTQREVAALTGVPLGTVKSRMFTGLQRLRGVLSPMVGDDNGRGGAR